MLRRLVALIVALAGSLVIVIGTASIASADCVADPVTGEVHCEEGEDGNNGGGTGNTGGSSTCTYAGNEIPCTGPGGSVWSSKYKCWIGERGPDDLVPPEGQTKEDGWWHVCYFPPPGSSWEYMWIETGEVGIDPVVLAQRAIASMDLDPIKIGFAIDGDVEWESLVLPDPDGFEVSRLELTRRNPYNATLAAAVATLIPEVSDVDTQAQLRLLGRQLAPQSNPPAVFPPLPVRHRGWQQAYDLARLVVEGLGLNLDGGAFTGPGFLLSTWSAWQSLCEEVVRRALPNHKVVGQMRWVLGHRGVQPVYATPDITPLRGTAASLLLDAKYKTRVGRVPSISSADVYESVAFLRASGAATMKLLYPALSAPDQLPLGEWKSFDEVKIDELSITGYEVQVQGLAQAGGFDRLVAGARAALQPSLEPAANATQTA